MPEGIGYGPESRKRVSEKVSFVRRHNPTLTAKQAQGKAYGILRTEGRKPRRPRASRLLR